MYAIEPWHEPPARGLSEVIPVTQRSTSHGRVGEGEPARAGRAAGRGVKLSILMPVFNEERTIAQAVEEVLLTPYPCDFELIVVDDGSTDATGGLLAAMHHDRLVVHRHGQNRGKGAALRTAVSLARGSHVIPFDADLEYAAEDIPRLLDPVLKGRCDVVYGVRMFGFNTVYHSLRYAAGNRFLTKLANVLFDACMSDLHTCLKLIPRPMLTALDLSEDRFGLDTEITALLLRNGVRPFEVPVSYYSRSHADGKKIKMRDALVCAWVLVKVRLRRLDAQAAALPEVPAPDPDGQGRPGPLRPVKLGEPSSAIATGQAS